MFGLPGVKCGSHAKKGASRGRQEKEAIVTVYVLYYFEDNAVWYCYCCNLGSYSLCVVL